VTLWAPQCCWSSTSWKWGLLLQVWCTAIPLYAVMPASIEWAAEQGWTRAYSRWGAKAQWAATGFHTLPSLAPPLNQLHSVVARHEMSNRERCIDVPAAGWLTWGWGGMSCTLRRSWHRWRRACTPCTARSTMCGCTGGTLVCCSTPWSSLHRQTREPGPPLCRQMHSSRTPTDVHAPRDYTAHCTSLRKFSKAASELGDARSCAALCASIWMIA
jgi:hypothetical protein